MINIRDLWSTPESVMIAMHNVMGCAPFIDLCASESNAKAETYVTPNALHFADGDIYDLPNGIFSLTPEDLIAWCGDRTIDPTVKFAWMNPPYSRGNMDKFTAWAANYADRGGVVAICHRPDLSTKWYQENVLPRTKVLYIPTKRIKFEPPEGVEEFAGSPNFAAVISVIGRKLSDCREVKRLDL